MPDEVNAQTPEEIAAAAAPVVAAPETVSKADYDKMAAEVEGLKGALAGAGQKLAVLDKVAEALGDKPAGSTLTKEEQAVVAELQRLMPHILPNAKLLDQAPQLLQTVQSASRAAAQGMVEAAYGYQLELQNGAGLKTDDQDFNFVVGGAIKEFINADKDRQARFWRGDRTVIEEGFKHVQKHFGGTSRSKAAMDTVNSRPRNTGPTGQAGATGSPKVVDFADKKSVRDAFKAALA
jgi:hypothetical protein